MKRGRFFLIDRFETHEYILVTGVILPGMGPLRVSSESADPLCSAAAMILRRKSNGLFVLWRPTYELKYLSGQRLDFMLRVNEGGSRGGCG